MVAQPEIVLEPNTPGPGDIVVVTVKNAAGPVEGKFRDRKVYFHSSKDSLKALVGIDLLTEPGEYALDLFVNGAVLSRAITVVKK